MTGKRRRSFAIAQDDEGKSKDDEGKSKNDREKYQT
jgi:hypothetical protein